MDRRTVSTDPVIGAIAAYQDGNKAFCAMQEAEWETLGGEDAAIRMTYGAPLDALNNWSAPCTSMAGAVAALRFALQETEVFYCEPSIVSMVKAALGYLEKQNN